MLNFSEKNYLKIINKIYFLITYTVVITIMFHDNFSNLVLMNIEKYIDIDNDINICFWLFVL